VYDTAQKLDAYYKSWEKAFLESELSSDVTENTFSNMRRMRPLAVVGPVAVFFDDNSGCYKVCEGDVYKPLVMYDRSNERFNRLYLDSKVENGWQFSRFSGVLSYSKDGIYERGTFSFHRDDGMPARTYLDTKGIGIFDRMYVVENGIINTYHLNGLSWEKVADEEQPD